MTQPQSKDTKNLMKDDAASVADEHDAAEALLARAQASELDADPAALDQAEIRTQMEAALQSSTVRLASMLLTFRDELQGFIDAEGPRVERVGFNRVDSSDITARLVDSCRAFVEGLEEFEFSANDGIAIIQHRMIASDAQREARIFLTVLEDPGSRESYMVGAAIDMHSTLSKAAHGAGSVALAD